MSQTTFLNLLSPAIASLMQSVTNLCEHCKVKPKHFDGMKLHPYCGKTCANTAQAQVQAPSQSSQNQPLCIICMSQPRYNDGKTLHQYCSKTCARSPSTPVVSKVNGPVCSISGCQKAAYAGPSGGPSNFCSLTHKKLAEEACLWCKKAPKKISHFCSRTCAQSAQQTSPALLEVPEGHVTFKSVVEQFKASWRHTNKACPAVRHIYKIIVSQASLDKYDAYRDSVEARGQFKSAGRSAGNENRRWHGTRRECNLGDQGNTQFCSSANCTLCCIAKKSYDMSFIKRGTFGAGIYTSSTSSNSDGYASNVKKSPLKAIFLNKVVVGKGYKVTVANTTLTAPPTGYDSVLAEKGGIISYDELVVFSNDAIRPSFLVMYDS